ncbi:pyrroloquinoline quinone biosynthesis protein B [Variovorax paradoxus]|uniref:Coenzyme PQQ synthesis protein B n=1 Tax=Variovorax paradoxus TaxID=34073 RepID=A0AAE4C071_VARPD|nr:pyrroloquinoline quinone biosynthesis protein PqqB [Variovorax paradoxus]MDP9968276.1 pyrroloquinoline quinone biosynthesis protein B [Variovorax paradoxus]MDR6429648.1 pyrroloquinoline quinone biosynthesis protein B [Variovorax paradoxus]
MKVLVLGSGAGGCFPQWNCNCRLCAGQRQGVLDACARTQSSVAVSADGESWVLLNASPDIGQQIRSHPQLHPRHGLRDTPIKAVVLMDAQIDHVAGLLGLREGPRIDLYATPCVFEDLTTSFPVLGVLEHYCGTRWHMLAVAGTQTRVDFGVAGFPSLRFTAVAIPGKAPPYSPHRRGQAVGDNIALRIEDLQGGRRLFYAPGLAEIGPEELRWMHDADCLLLDGTFWTEDEMRHAGLGTRSASDMGHLPQTGTGPRAGMVDALRATPARRKVLTHINNSNPILDAASAQRQELERHGIEVAYDGMEISL